MEPVLKDPILEFPPDLVKVVRKKHNLDQPGRMEEAINILEEWIKKQDHFTKKQYDRFYLENCLITSKGLIERAKMRIDRCCTLRSMLPEFFDDINPKKDLSGLEKQAEYTKMHDYIDRFVIIYDFSPVNIMDLITTVNLVEVRNVLTILMQGYGLGVQGIHLIVKPCVSSTVLEALLKLLKNMVLSPKLQNRIHIHTSYEALHKHVPREILPLEYGGNEISIHELSDKWLEVLSSEEHLTTMKEMNKAKVNESLRAQKDKFNDEYLGLPGSFRQLNVD